MITCPRCNGSFPDDVSTCPHDGERLAGPAPELSEEDLPAGMMVGEYRIEKKLGEGGFGAVYRAAHHVIQKAVAVKVLNRTASADPAMVSRFTSEARVVNQIRHRNIVDIFAFGRLPDGRHYHVMELLDGVPLDEHLHARGRLSFEEAYPIFRGVARALSAAHGAGVVHRDLKPANIFLVRDEDSGFVPRLIDFGIAKLNDDQASHKTKTGAMMGTAYYMSPEQCRGKSVDARTDIYAFGVVVHVALTGHKVFDGESVMDVVMKQITEAPPRMSLVCPDVPAALDEPVLRMLEKDPARRPQTILEALSALESAANAAPPPSSEERRSAVPAAEEARVSQVGDRQSLSQDTNSASALARTEITAPSFADGVRPAASRGRGVMLGVGVLVAAVAGFAITIPMFRSSAGGSSAPGGTTTVSPAAAASESATGERPSVVPAATVLPQAPADSTARAAASTSGAATAAVTVPGKASSSPAASATVAAAPTTSAKAQGSSSPAATGPKPVKPKTPQDDLDF